MTTKQNIDTLNDCICLLKAREIILDEIDGPFENHETVKSANIIKAIFDFKMESINME